MLFFLILSIAWLTLIAVVFTVMFLAAVSSGRKLEVNLTFSFWLSVVTAASFIAYYFIT
jgi:hypothetical protein